MSDKNPYNDEYERYLNDPEYRKQKKKAERGSEKCKYKSFFRCNPKTETESQTR